MRQPWQAAVVACQASGFQGRGRPRHVPQVSHLCCNSRKLVSYIPIMKKHCMPSVLQQQEV